MASVSNQTQVIAPPSSGVTVTDGVPDGYSTPRTTGTLQRSLIALNTSPSRVVDALTKNLTKPTEQGREAVRSMMDEPSSFNEGALTALEQAAEKMQLFVSQLLKEDAADSHLDPDETDNKDATGSNVSLDKHPKPIRIPTARMVHEARTPLYSIAMSLRLLKEISQSRALESTDFVELYHSYLFLDGFLQTLQSTRRTQTDEICLLLDIRDPIILKNLCETVQGLTSRIAAMDTVQIVLDREKINLDDFERQLKGDFRKLSHILINLISNAIKYSCKPGKVIIRIMSLGTGGQGKINIRFEVENQGPVIPQHIQKRLFKLHSQGDRATNTQIKDSSGVGLYLSQQFVKLMGGDITVESCHRSTDLDDEGITTFRFELSFEKNERPLSVSSAPASVGSPLLPSHTLIQLSDHNLQILLADDVSMNLKIFSTMLRKYGCENITICNNGQTALEAIEKNHFDVCILDMHMQEFEEVVVHGEKIKKEITGWDTALKIHKTLTSRALPLIYFCTADDVRDIQQNIEEYAKENPEAASKMGVFEKGGTSVKEIVEAINAYYAADKERQIASIE